VRKDDSFLGFILLAPICVNSFENICRCYGHVNHSTDQLNGVTYNVLFLFNSS